jgi:hypothetical protein
MVSMNLTTRGSVDITILYVRATPRKSLTPSDDSPPVVPVAAKATSVPRMRSSSNSFRSRSPKPDSSDCPTWALRRPHPGLHLPAGALHHDRSEDSPGLDGEICFWPTGPERVARAHYAVIATWRAGPPSLVQTLLAQHRHTTRDRHLPQLLQKRLRRQRMGPLRVTRPFEPGHLQGNPLGHSVLHGGRGDGSRTGIGYANGFSPNLHNPR